MKMTADCKTADHESSTNGDVQSTTFQNDDHANQPRNPHTMGKKINEYQALMSLIKGNIGTGILSMPVVIRYAGLWTGFTMIIASGILSTYLMHVLLRTANAVQQRHNWDRSKMDYAETAFLVLKYGPERLRKLKGKLKHTVNGFLILTQVGTCCVYTLFITENIRYFLVSFFPYLTLNVYLVGFIVCLILILMNFKSSMRVVTYLSGLANVCTAIGMILIFVYLFTSGLHSIYEFPAITNFNGLLIAFSIVMFSFEGISLVLPLQSKMIDPTRYGLPFGVLTTGMIIVICMNVAVGFYGFLKFGEESEGSITLNIPQVPYWFAPVKPLFIIAMFVSYLLQYYVPAQIFSRLMEKLTCHRDASDRRRYINLKLMRIGMVIFSYAAAVLIPRLDLLLSLIGSLAGSTLAFILPATLEIIFLWSDRQQISWFWLTVFTKHIIFISIGLLSCFGGLIATIIQIIKAFHSK
ncbi:amino acid transporter, putative [Schistosoma mansoni]|uniref:amino acid transporter, putative n=1 Tax=Schistosoma mansoni TaxID=6183 RepID=UPI0001A63BC6|nr:amino acid transporter, putative [Schistosoma mansoni]|eukprot:XP_018645556.1 amino acid transporter, putative [Schistosoma mansoni]